MFRVEMLRPGVLYLVSLLGLAGLRSGADVSAPAWRAKEKYYARVQGGEPIVTVTTTAGTGSNRRLKIAGGGRVKAPLQFTYEYSKKLDVVARTSGYVESARMNAARDQLHLTFKALGLRADFDIGVKTDDAHHRLTFEILGGPMKGLKSDLTFTSIDPLETEVAILGEHEYHTFPFRDGLQAVGLETVFKKMAERLRDAVVVAFRSVDNVAPGVEDSAASSREP